MKEYNHQIKRYIDYEPFPVHVDLEINSRCNFRCTMCPQSLPKNDRHFSHGKMEINNIKSIIDYCANMGTKSMKFFWRGEPTVDDRLPYVLAHAKQVGIYTQINTNGTFPLKNRVEIAKSLDWISFSLDKYHENNHERNDILENVSFFQNTSTHTEVQSSTPTESLMKFCDENGIVFVPDALTKRTPEGSSYDYLSLDGKKRQNCKYPFWRMIITWDLKVKPCCVVWDDGQLEMGTLKNNDGELDLGKILLIWHGKEFKQLREDQLRLSYTSEACRNCVSSAAYVLEGTDNAVFKLELQ